MTNNEYNIFIDTNHLPPTDNRHKACCPFFFAHGSLLLIENNKCSWGGNYKKRGVTTKISPLKDVF